MSKEMLMEKFNEKVGEVKKNAKEVLIALDAFIANSTGDTVALSFEETVPKDDAIAFKNKVQKIIDVDITTDNVPKFYDINTNLLLEFLEFDRIVDELTNIVYDIMVADVLPE